MPRPASTAADAGVEPGRLVFADSPPEEIRNIVDTNADYFETQVVSCAIQSPSFRAAVAGLLCVESAAGECASDFSRDVDNALFRVVRDQDKILGATVGPVISEAFARVLLEQLAGGIKPGNMPPIGLSEIDAALARLQECGAVNLAEALPVALAGFKHWLKKTRVTRTIRGATALADWDPTVVLEMARQETDAIDANVSDDHAQPFGAGLDDAPDDLQRISTGLRCLDTPLGGGFAPREFTLFIAATGVGKTVVATHLAGHFAGMGLRGLLITTEEKRRDLEVRIVSNRARIPYARIAGKFDERLLQPDERERYRTVRKQLDGKLTIVEWLGGHGRSVREDLEGEVRKHAPLDFVILDWIGGALAETKPEFRRLAFQDAADKLGEIAVGRKLICIGLAQAHPQLSRNKAKVDSTMLCECKTMGQRAANVIGMSGLEEAVEEGCESERIYQPRQFFFIGKCRKSKGGLKPFRREFDYQRICDV